MKKLLFTITVLLLSVSFAYADYRWVSYHWDANLQDSEYGFQHGHYVATNAVVNGEIIQTNAFVPDSQPVLYIKKGGDFINVTGAMIQQNAVNPSAIANATTDGTIQNVSIEGFDTTTTDEGPAPTGTSTSTDTSTSTGV